MSSKMSIQGTIKAIGQVQQFKSGSYKRSLVLTTSETYPQTLEVEFWNEGADALNNYDPGNEVSIDFNLNGREWTNQTTGKTSIFISLKGYKIDLVDARAVLPGHTNQAPPSPGNQVPHQAPANPGAVIRNEEEDDLPF